MVAPTQSIAPELLRWIPLIPLLACLLNTFFGARLGKRGAGLLASFAVGASFAIALYIFWLLPASGVIRDTVYTWIESGSFQVKVSFQVDALTAVMLLVVTGVGFLIHIYSLGYMGHDEGMVRFFIYLNLFIFFMLLLVMGDNVLLLFVGCFMEGIAAMLILIPILVPVAMKLGIDPVHFGLIFVLNLMIGTVTPPVGVVLYVVSNIAKISFERMARAIVPFLIPLIVVLAASTLWPPLTTWLPGLLIGR